MNATSTSKQFFYIYARRTNYQLGEQKTLKAYRKVMSE